MGITTLSIVHLIFVNIQSLDGLHPYLIHSPFDPVIIYRSRFN